MFNLVAPLLAVELLASAQSDPHSGLRIQNDGSAIAQQVAVTVSLLPAPPAAAMFVYVGGCLCLSLQAQPASRPLLETAQTKLESGDRGQGASDRPRDESISFDARMGDGSVVGELILGQTSFQTASWIYSRPSLQERDEGLGRRTKIARRRWKQVDPEGRVRRIVGVPTATYRFWGSPQILLFDDDKKLVALMEPGDELEGLGMSEALDLFPGLERTVRAEGLASRAFEMQAQVSRTVRLVMFFDRKSERSVAIAYYWVPPSPRK